MVSFLVTVYGVGTNTSPLAAFATRVVPIIYYQNI